MELKDITMNELIEMRENAEAEERKIRVEINQINNFIKKKEILNDESIRNMVGKCFSCVSDSEDIKFRANKYINVVGIDEFNNLSAVEVTENKSILYLKLYWINPDNIDDYQEISKVEYDSEYEKTNNFLKELHYVLDDGTEES